MQTERLRYETLATDHAEALAEALTDVRVYAHIGGEIPQNAAALAAKFERIMAGPPAHFVGERWWHFAVFERVSGTGIGTIEATLIENRAEVGFLFGPAHWGKGYAREALAWLHTQLALSGETNELWATVTPGNTRSARVLAHFGYAQVEGPYPLLASYDDGDWVFRRAITPSPCGIRHRPP
jgi:[ribosomal protein S5]-alanine N-acetyltransferase